jgi:RimJ/RimL family protein N-acetyltransferase
VRALRACAHVPEPRAVHVSGARSPLPILTPRLRLRALRESDLADLQRLWTDPRVTEWIGEHTSEDVLEELHDHIAHEHEHGWALWAVEERASGRFLGDCGLQPLEHRGPEVELGYELLPEVWGSGLATEAVAATLEAAFGPLQMPRVVAVVKPGNERSVRVLEKAGLARAGERVAYGERMLFFEASASPGAAPQRR